MTAAQAKEMMKVDSGKNYKVVPKKKKIDFNVKRDCYQENVKQFDFDLDTVKRNTKGVIQKTVPKKAEELAETEFKNQVYERIF